MSWGWAAVLFCIGAGGIWLLLWLCDHAPELLELEPDESPGDGLEQAGLQDRIDDERARRRVHRGENE